jgi:rSAM/selenodomain-associated transferase 1
LIEIILVDGGSGADSALRLAYSAAPMRAPSQGATDMSHESPESVAIAIFAKAPIAGFAKTRLVPRLGAEGAAKLQRQLIERAVRIACESRSGPVSLWCSPNADHDCFRSLREQWDVALHDQIDADLGARMHHAFLAHTKASPMLLIGTDCVTLTSQHITESADRLRAGGNAVVIPVEDGGYILIGLREPVPALFTNIAWGTKNVMVETRARANAVGVEVLELPPLWDIDRIEDYERAVAAGYL